MPIIGAHVDSSGGLHLAYEAAQTQRAPHAPGHYDLTTHLRANRKDHHSRRGLLMLVGRRRRLLNYLQRSDLERYRSVIRELGLRR